MKKILLSALLITTGILANEANFNDLPIEVKKRIISDAANSDDLCSSANSLVNKEWSAVCLERYKDDLVSQLKAILILSVVGFMGNVVRPQLNEHAETLPNGDNNELAKLVQVKALDLVNWVGLNFFENLEFRLRELIQGDSFNSVAKKVNYLLTISFANFLRELNPNLANYDCLEQKQEFFEPSIVQNAIDGYVSISIEQFLDYGLFLERLKGKIAKNDVSQARPYIQEGCSALVSALEKQKHYSYTFVFDQTPMLRRILLRMLLIFIEESNIEGLIILGKYTNIDIFTMFLVCASHYHMKATLSEDISQELIEVNSVFEPNPIVKQMLQDAIDDLKKMNEGDAITKMARSYNIASEVAKTILALSKANKIDEPKASSSASTE